MSEQERLEEFALHSGKQVTVEEVSRPLMEHMGRTTLPGPFEITVVSGRRPALDSARFIPAFPPLNMSRTFRRARNAIVRCGLMSFGLANMTTQPTNPLRPLLEAGVWSVLVQGWKILVQALPKQTYQDAAGSVHRVSGPAIEWADGLGEYFIHGAHFSLFDHTKLVKREMTAKEAISFPNLTQRQAAVQFLGYERVLEQLRAKKIDGFARPHPKRDMRYALYKVQLNDDPRLGKRLARLLRVTCPSTGHEAILRVPPRIDSAVEAVAWTFGITPEQYAELREEA